PRGTADATKHSRSCPAAADTVHLYCTAIPAMSAGEDAALMTMQIPPPVGRAAGVSPGNRFEHVHRVDDFEQFDHSEGLPIVTRMPTEFLPDRSRTVISHNDSPDIGFRYSINPYRGCEHGCAYCYARPGHEYLGMNAGLDFESRILV